MPLDSGGKIRKRKAQTSEGETRATLDVKKSLETEQGLQIEHQSATWSAPLPPPAALAQYEEILPGSAQKIFASFEERGNTRQQLEINEQRQEAKMQELTHDSFVSGQKYGWQISLVCIAAGLISIPLGAHASVSIAFVGVPMATIVRSFLKR